MSDCITTLLLAATQSLEEELVRKKNELLAEERKLDQVKKAIKSSSIQKTVTKDGLTLDIFEHTFPCDMHFKCKGKIRKFRGRAQYLYDRRAYAWFEDGEDMVVEREDLIALPECSRTSKCVRGENHRGRCSTTTRIVARE